MSAPLKLGAVPYRPAAYQSVVPSGFLSVRGRSYDTHSPQLAHNLGIDSVYEMQRFEVRGGEHWSGDTTSERSELAGKDQFDFDRDVWMSYALMVEPGPVNTAPWCIFGQWHASEDAGDIHASPPWACSINAQDQLVIDTRGSAADPLVGIPAPTIRWTSSGYVRGTWIRFVHRMRFSPFGSGQLQIWVDGAEVVNLSGLTNAYNDVKGPYWKFGIYRGQALGGETIAARYANMEISYESLFERVARPLYFPLT